MFIGNNFIGRRAPCTISIFLMFDYFCLTILMFDYFCVFCKSTLLENPSI